MNRLRALWFDLTGRHRHTWDIAPADTLPSGRVIGPWLHCTLCGETKLLLAEPPHEHPDSMTAELPREQEEWLAAVDRELWEKEAT